MRDHVLRIVLFVIVAGLIAARPDVGAVAAAGYSPGETLFSFRDPRITESSGVVASSVRDDVFYTHNDSGDAARFFAVDRLGCSLKTFNLAGTDAIDIEDIARGPAGDSSALWLADIGDNNHMRSTIVVHRIAEPNLDASPNRASEGCRATEEVATMPTSFTLVYPDHPHDAETLLADPATGQLLIVTKTPFGQSSVYTAPLPLRPDAVNVLSLAGTIVFPPSVTYDRPLVPASPGTQQGFDLAGRLMAVGGDVAPGRDRVVVRTYTDAWEWPIAEGQPIASALTATIPAQVPLVYQRQGEAIAYTRNGVDLVTACEDAGCTAHVYRGAAA